MQLYLLRHADAEAHAESDAARKLTDKGIEQAKRAGKFCRDHELIPEAVLASPYVRAEQTARLAAERFGGKVVVEKFLASGMKPQTALLELGRHAKFNAVMLVGHEPDFSRLAATLLGLSSNEQIHLKKSSLTLFEVRRLEAGAATLEWSLPVALM